MIRLPIKIDIIKHPQELNGKSTSTHAMILTTPPKDVRIFTYPDMPNDWHDLNKVCMCMIQFFFDIYDNNDYANCLCVCVFVLTLKKKQNKQTETVKMSVFQVFT